ncbi:MAG: glycosyltransferase, partial [Anaerolineae bacterium]|nr:glycosyltransferase [Anaerolineae bacterium]
MTEQTNPIVILPTYNEAENLGPMVQAILALARGFSVLVVDDNSPDGTGQIADTLSETHPEI